MRDLRRTVCATAGVLALLTVQPEAQRPPDLSGQWELVEALATGPGRDGSVSEKPRPTTSTTISGAPFNCGRGCTITQKGQMLTIQNAQLADYPGKDKSRPTPSVTLHFDGREATVVDSFSPGRELPATARLDGNKLRIESNQTGSVSTIERTQLLSLEAGQLIVVTSTMLNGEARAELTFRYRKKSRRRSFERCSRGGRGGAPRAVIGRRADDVVHGRSARKRRCCPTTPDVGIGALGDSKYFAGPHSSAMAA